MHLLFLKERLTCQILLTRFTDDLTLEHSLLFLKALSFDDKNIIESRNKTKLFKRSTLLLRTDRLHIITSHLWR
jgi:hypothetical protein